MKNRPRMCVVFVVFATAVLLHTACTQEGEVSSDEAGPKVASLTPIEELGKKLFFDDNLSSPPGQSCAFCHGEEVGFTGPLEEFNQSGAVYEGAVQGRFGNRKPPASAYAGDSPALHIDEEGLFVGGMFWDGRATGWELGDPLSEQAMGPFLNPLEMNCADKREVISKVRDSDYAEFFEKLWGEGTLDPERDIDGTYEKIARTIAAYERSAEVNPFSSKFDDFWRNARDIGLDPAEMDEINWQSYQNLGLEGNELEGFILFTTKGKCAQCHILDSVEGGPPLFTDFTYDNVGVPKNPELPFYGISEEWNPEGEEWVDKGLGGFLEASEEYAGLAAENYGKHKVPTLRNVDLRPYEGFVKRYMHNGVFTTLKEVVHFYNTRDVQEEQWPPSEIEANLNMEEMGNLGLTEEEEDAIVLFMKTLSDRK